MVFIDSRVSDYESLILQFAPGTEYQVLDANQDGIEQIANALSGHSGYGSIQLISHGASDSITIGNTKLDNTTLKQYAAELSVIGHALKESGDMLLYGCNVGAGAEGQAFVEMLSQMTGADVAASNDPTGGTPAGGDWALEVQSGVIETALPIASGALQQYEYTLADFFTAGDGKVIFDDAGNKLDSASILRDLNTAYSGSSIAKAMFDTWFSTAGHTINITYSPGHYRAYTDGTGRLEIDPAKLATLSAITKQGTAVYETQPEALLHELVHALKGLGDPNKPDTLLGALDYLGDTVRYSNTIYKELHMPEEAGYYAQEYDSSGLHRVQVGYSYTNGTTIDAARTGDVDMNSYGLLFSNDLLIGGPSANKLQSGFGDDFLFGAGGNDTLLGGPGNDTAVYFGSPLDYNILKLPDGTWKVDNVRGTENAGMDILENIELIKFETDSQSYQLSSNGLTFQTDFALVVDTTGSMWDDIDSVKAQASMLIDAAFAGGKADARIGVVTFKDTTNGEPSQVVLPFTDQNDFVERKAAAIAAINSIGLGDGGDWEETSYDGLRLALDGSMGQWRFGAGILRIVMFTDAPAKDGYLAAEVTALAHSIGATVGAHTLLAGAGGSSVDTFTLSFGSGDLSAEKFFGDDPFAGPLPPFELTDESVTPDATTSQVQIFTIVTGTPTFDTTSYESIASDNGGKYMNAADNDALIKALFEIISAPSDNVPPTVVTFNPLDSANGVELNSDINIIFSEVIHEGTGTIVLHRDSITGAVVESFNAASANMTISSSGTTLTINPTNDLAYGTHYFLVFGSDSINDEAANSYADEGYDFTTQVDNIPPTVVTFNPLDSATGVGINSDLVITFSEPIHAGTGTIDLHLGWENGPVVESFNAASANMTTSPSGTALTINPTNDLAYGTHYYLTFNSGSINDQADNSYADEGYDFTTVADPYAGSPEGANTGAVLGGIAGFGLLLWAIL